MTIGEDEVLTGLMDALLPGGEGFPRASATGMAPLLAARLTHADASLLARLAAAIAEAGIPADDAAWREAAARLEASGSALFDEIRKYAYLTYYEQPAVIASIRALGFPYNDAPLPAGYTDEPFEPERDAPRHARGRFVTTDAVRRVDLGSLGLETMK